MLYVAVLLKRRVALIAPDADRVVRLLEATAALAPHRKDTSILFPNIDIVCRLGLRSRGGAGRVFSLIGGPCFLPHWRFFTSHSLM